MSMRFLHLFSRCPIKPNTEFIANFSAKRQTAVDIYVEQKKEEMNVPNGDPTEKDIVKTLKEQFKELSDYEKDYFSTLAKKRMESINEANEIANSSKVKGRRLSGYQYYLKVSSQDLPPDTNKLVTLAARWRQMSQWEKDQFKSQAEQYNDAHL